MLITVSRKKWECRLVPSNSIKMRRLIDHHGTIITCDMIYMDHVSGTFLSNVQRLLGFGDVLNVFLEDKPRPKWSLCTTRVYFGSLR